MTDQEAREIARLLALGRRQGFDRACGVALVAFIVAGAGVLFFTDQAVKAVPALSGFVLTVLVIASAVTNKDPYEPPNED